MTFLAAAAFNDIFPNFEDQIQTLFDLLLPVGAVLIIVGLISALRYAYTPRSMMRALMVTVLITTALALWGDWMNLAQEGIASVVDEMKASPTKTAGRYIELVTKESSSDGFSLFDISFTMIIDFIVAGFLNVIGLIASAIIWVAYLIQKFFLGFSYAFAPLFLGMLALRSTGSIGVRYIMGTVGILIWPVGWAAAAIGTSNLIDLFVARKFADLGGVYSQQVTLGAAIIGIWIIGSTLIGPIIIQKAIASGANIGAALASGGTTSVADAGKAALGAGAAIAAAGATGATGGAGALAIGAGGLAAASSSAAGATMRGGGGGFSGHSLQSLVPKLAAASGGGHTSAAASPSNRISSANGGSSTSPNLTAPSSQTPAAISDLTRDRSAAAVVGPRPQSKRIR